jgi:hypothetical protein
LGRRPHGWNLLVGLLATQLPVHRVCGDLIIHTHQLKLFGDLQIFPSAFLRRAQ